jgi:hypothetical protein
VIPTVSFLGLGLVLGIELISLYSKLKLLLSSRRCSSQGQFMGFSRIFRSLVDISRNLIFIEFSRILRLVDFGRFSRF